MNKTEENLRNFQISLDYIKKNKISEAEKLLLKLKEDEKFNLRKFRRLASKDHVIPASISLEKDTLISSQKIKDNINEILNV